MAKTEKKPLHYIWIPGQGPTEDALERLLALVPERPSEAPALTRVFGDKKLYSSFVDLPIDKIPERELAHFFVTSSIVCVSDSDEQIENWDRWSLYLLPRLLDRAAGAVENPVLLEAMFTFFFDLKASLDEEPYDGFTRDILNTLGRLIMRADAFDENDESLCAHYWDWKVAPGTIWPRCNGPISASLFLCLCHLPLEEIEIWTGSVVSIESIFFRANFLAWLTGSFELLSKASNSNPFVDLARSVVKIDWTYSEILVDYPLVIPEGNIQRFYRTVRELLTFDKLVSWAEDLRRYPELAKAMKSARIVDFVADTVLIS
jgi:hypothetical protein